MAIDVSELRQSNEELSNSFEKNYEVDLNRLFSEVWSKKWIIFFITSLFVLSSALYSLTLQNMYRSELLLAPTEEQDVSSIGGQLGGLAALTGVNLKGGLTVDKNTLALEILKSRDFTSTFIIKHNLLAAIMAVKGWNVEARQLVFDDHLYDVENDSWVQKDTDLKSSKPSMQEAHLKFHKRFSATKNTKTGMITFAFEHESPDFAKKLLDLILIDINTEIKKRDINEAENSLLYLSKKIDSTTNVEMKSVLFSLITEQNKKLMLANIRDEYVFKVIDSSIVPEEKFSPKRSLIVVVSMIVGLMFSLFVVLLLPSFSREAKD